MENRSRLLTLVGPPAIYLVLFFILPLGIMTLFSFKAGTLGSEQGELSLKNYQLFLGTPSFIRLLFRSGLIALVVASISTVLAYPLAYYLAFQAGEKRVMLLTLMIIPTWTSYLLRIFAWKLILGSNGLLNSLLLWAGVIDQASPILLYSRTAVMITLVYVWVPFVAMPIFAALGRIDKSLLEAAMDLGCPPFEAFLRVTLPLSLPGVVAGFSSA